MFILPLRLETFEHIRRKKIIIFGIIIEIH